MLMMEKNSMPGGGPRVTSASSAKRSPPLIALRPDEIGAVTLLVLFGLAWPVLAYAGLGFWAEVANRILVLALAAVSLNLLIGIAGLHSLGHAMFFSIGAYCVGISSHYGSDNGYVHLALSVVTSALVGTAIGLVALRTREAHFIMLTLAFGQMAYFTLMSLREYGGDDGLTINGTSMFSWGLDLGNRPTLYYVSLGALAFALLGFIRIKGSRFGLVLAAANQSEQRVEASGFSVDRYRLVAFVLAAVVCSVAGLLNANLTSFVTPDLTSWKLSAALMFMVVLGGSATACGPVLGAATFVLIEQLLGSKTAYWEFWFGAFLIIAVSGARQGLAGLLLGRKGGSA